MGTELSLLNIFLLNRSFCRLLINSIIPKYPVFKQPIKIVKEIPCLLILTLSLTLKIIPLHQI